MMTNMNYEIPMLVSLCLKGLWYVLPVFSALIFSDEGIVSGEDNGIKLLHKRKRMMKEYYTEHCLF